MPATYALKVKTKLPSGTTSTATYSGFAEDCATIDSALVNLTVGLDNIQLGTATNAYRVKTEELDID